MDGSPRDTGRVMGRATEGLNLKHLIVIAIAALFTGCSAPTTAPTAPVSLSVAGNWSGDYSTDDGSGSIKFSLTQVGVIVGGTWTIDPNFAGNPPVRPPATSGTVSGSNSLTGAVGGTFRLTFSQSDPRNCPFESTMTLVTTTQMTGLWVSTNCTKAVSGRLKAYR